MGEVYLALDTAPDRLSRLIHDGAASGRIPLCGVVRRVRLQNRLRV